MTTNTIDVSQVFQKTSPHAVGRKVKFTMTKGLLQAIHGAPDLTMKAFATETWRAISGKREDFEDGYWAWADTGDGERLFRCGDLWAGVRPVTGWMVLDLPDHHRVKEATVAKTNKVLLDLEAAGVVRRVGFLDGDVVWKMVRPS